MATLIVQRDRGYADALRAYDIELDGTVIGRINQGEVLRFPLSAGSHRLRVKIDWCSSETLDLQVGTDETVSVLAASNLRGAMVFLAIWYVLFARDQYLHLSRV